MEPNDGTIMSIDIENDLILHRKYAFLCRVKGTKALLINFCNRLNIKGRAKKVFENGQLLTCLECVGPSSLMSHFHSRLQAEDLLKANMKIKYEQKFEKSNMFDSEEIMDLFSSNESIVQTPEHLRKAPDFASSDDGQQLEKFSSFSQKINPKEAAKSWIANFVNKSIKFFSKIPHEKAQKIGEMNLTSTLDEEKLCEINCKKISIKNERIEVTLLESETPATAKAFILHKYKLNQNDHKNIILFHEDGSEVEEYSPVKKSQTYLFGFADVITNWAKENPEFYNILKKYGLGEKDFAVCGMAMMDFNKVNAEMMVKKNEIKKFLIRLGLDESFASVLEGMFEELVKK